MFDVEDTRPDRHIPEPPPPPPTAWERLQAWVARVTLLKVAAALGISAVSGLFFGGYAAHAQISKIPTREEVAAVEARVRASLANHEAQPHDSTRERLADHDVRLARLETSMAWIERALYATASRVGARVSPPPSADTP